MRVFGWSAAIDDVTGDIDYHLSRRASGKIPEVPPVQMVIRGSGMFVPEGS